MFSTWLTENISSSPSLRLSFFPQALNKLGQRHKPTICLRLRAVGFTFLLRRPPLSTHRYTITNPQRHVAGRFSEWFGVWLLLTVGLEGECRAQPCQQMWGSSVSIHSKRVGTQLLLIKLIYNTLTRWHQQNSSKRNSKHLIKQLNKIKNIYFPLSAYHSNITVTGWGSLFIYLLCLYFCPTAIWLSW